MNPIAKSIQFIEENIQRIAERCGRDPNEIQIVAVSKTHPAESVREAYKAGMRIFGENRVQEAESKIIDLKDLSAEWHLIGHLQTNKIKKAIALFQLIHSVDSVKLIDALERELEKTEEIRSILLQLNLSGEESKSGASAAELETLLTAVKNAPHLKCKGLMTIPPFDEEIENTRPYFRQLRKLSEEYRNDLAAPTGRIELSMGMTGDYPAAIEEGATYVRIGTAIFGGRF